VGELNYVLVPLAEVDDLFPVGPVLKTAPTEVGVLNYVLVPLAEVDDLFSVGPVLKIAVTHMEAAL
jgi:hypothetical protein